MLWVILGIGAVLVFWVIGMYNALVTSRNRVGNAWSQIDVQLKRRHDLIPNLVETVKGFMKHEREVLENVIKARQMAVSASGVQDTMQAENMLTGALKSLFAVSEAYPDLKANTNMQTLQEELTATENKIAFARQHYNDSVTTYNIKLEAFPSNLIANAFNFRMKILFEVDSLEEREPVKVSFEEPPVIKESM